MSGPNIIYFRSKEIVGRDADFQILNSVLRAGLYTPYDRSFSKKHILEPWRKNSCCVILNKIDAFDFFEHKDAFEQYILNCRGRLFLNEVLGGKIEAESWVIDAFGKKAEIEDTKISGVFKSIVNESKIIFSLEDQFANKENLGSILEMLGLERSTEEQEEPTTLSPFFVYGSVNHKVSFFQKLVATMKKNGKHPSSGEGEIGIFEKIEDAYEAAANGNFAFVSPLCLSHQKSNFDEASYNTNNFCKILGKLVIHTDVTTSTVDLFEKNPFLALCEPDFYRSIVVANRQLKGKGRVVNRWLSPKGSISLTIPVKLETDSKLYECVSIIQHVLALSFLKAVEFVTKTKNLPLFLKWPNDIYYKRECKIGGILVKGYTCGNTITALLSIGANVFNEAPTISLLHILQKEVAEADNYVANFTNENLIASTLTFLEEYLVNFELNFDDTMKNFIHDYNTKHISMNQQIHVKLPNSEHKVEATVLGIDKRGYMMVRLKDDDNTFCVQPDGNTFDVGFEPTIIVNVSK